MIERPSDEAVERMVAFIRSIAVKHASNPIGNTETKHMVLEAREIIDMLPEPVDPDMIEAREVVCRTHHDKHPGSPWHDDQAAAVRAGCWDCRLNVIAAYEGIKRGRALAGQPQ